MNRQYKTLLTGLTLLAFTLTLSGCGSSRGNNQIMSYITTNSAPSPTTDSNTQAQLAEAANSVSQSLQNLSAISRSAHPQARLAPPVNPNRIGMAQTASLDWTGPIEPLSRKVARATGYKFQTLGQRPSSPIIVSISRKNASLAAILRDAIYQAQTQANVSVYPASKLIELRYNNK